MAENEEREPSTATQANSTLGEIMFSHGADLPKERAIELCASHLGGSWTADLTPDDIDLTVIQAGFMNRIFVCHNKKTNDKVLIRLYGGKIQKITKNNTIAHTLRSVGIEGEVLIFHLADLAGIGPKLLGVFDGGRIEGYIEGETLTDADCSSDDIMCAFARKLACMHSMKVPVNKKPKDLVKMVRDKFDNHWDSYKEMINHWPVADDMPEEQKHAVAMVMDYDTKSLMDWFENTFPTMKYRIAFCHGDTNRANCIVDRSKTGDDRVTILDYEFAGYNYRGCDIGYHFKHRSIDVSKFTKGENAFDMPIPYPSEKERRRFVRAYLEVASKSYPDYDPRGLDSEEQLLLEAEFFGALFQAFFTSMMITASQDPFWKENIKKMNDTAFKLHPALMLAGFFKDMEDRKANVNDLVTRLANLKL